MHPLQTVIAPPLKILLKLGLFAKKAFTVLIIVKAFLHFINKSYFKFNKIDI